MDDSRPVEESAEELIVPVTAEELHVGKQRIETGRVRISKRVSEHEELVDESGFTEAVEVERVPIDRVLDAPVEPRYEGDTLIVPVMEERLVVEKQLILKEELRITKRRHEVPSHHRVKLRSEEVQVKRTKAKQDDEESHRSP